MKKQFKKPPLMKSLALSKMLVAKYRWLGVWFNICPILASFHSSNKLFDRDESNLWANGIKHNYYNNNNGYSLVLAIG